MTNVLIVDDDETLCQLLIDYLEPEGFAVSAVHNGREGLAQAGNDHFDVMILDVTMPGMMGTDVLRELRKTSSLPVIMLTARGDDVDRIVGLELGADDYMPKPFNTRELVARIRAVLRRGASTSELSVFNCGGLSVSTQARSATWKGQQLPLTSTEFSILALLVQKAGAVVTKEEIYEKALGRKRAAFDRSIDMHISHLRRKLKDCVPLDPIQTVRGRGYQYVVPVN